MAFPGPTRSFSTKNEVADYLEAYAARFELPVRTGVRAERVSRNGSCFEVEAGDRVFEAENVIVAMASHGVPRLPPFAPELDPGIVLHSGEYRSPAQLQEGPVLVVGGRKLGRRDRDRGGRGAPDLARGEGAVMSPSASRAVRHGSSSYR